MQTELLVNIIIFSIVGTFFTIALAIRIYICCSQPQSETDSDFDLQTAEPQIDIKEQELIWTQADITLKKNQQCCICLENRVDTMTSCKHKFHMNCLVQWKKRLKNICPYCKGQSLQNMTFYCQSCRKQKFLYKFQTPQHKPRNHMIPKFFLSFINSENKLKCHHCRQYGTQDPQCMTRNLESVKGSEDYIKSNKTSRNKQPVDIVIKQSRSSQQKQSQLQSENNDILVQPLTGNRLLFKVDY